MSAAHRHISFWIKAGFAAAACGYVAWSLYSRRAEMQDTASAFDALNWGWFAVAFFLLGGNIGAEAWKWQVLVRRLYPALTFSASVRAVLAGMSTGIFTPNRIGEYAGRILFLKEGKRMEAIIYTFLSRLSLMFVTLLAGAVALLYGSLLKFEVYAAWYIALLIAALLVTGVIIFFPELPGKLLFRENSQRAWLRKVRFALLNIPRRDAVAVAAISALRYFVFTAQYLCLLYAFGYCGNIFPHAVQAVVVIFLVKSFLPFTGIFELGSREAIALYIMEAYHVSCAGAGSEMLAVTSTFVLFLINSILPALIGLIFLRQLKIGEES